MPEADVQVLFSRRSRYVCDKFVVISIRLTFKIATLDRPLPTSRCQILFNAIIYQYVWCNACIDCDWSSRDWEYDWDYKIEILLNRNESKVSSSCVPPRNFPFLSVSSFQAKLQTKTEPWWVTKRKKRKGRKKERCNVWHLVNTEVLKMHLNGKVILTQSDTKGFAHKFSDCDFFFIRAHSSEPYLPVSQFIYGG